MTKDLAFSRPVLTADRLGDAAEDRHRFLDKHVLLRGEEDALRMQNGRLCMTASLSLLHRICRNVTLELPRSSDLARELQALLERTQFGAARVVATAAAEFEAYDAILSVGATVRRDLPWTTINCNGWLARVSSGPSSLPKECSQTNPVSALAAASLGVAEVFKRLIALKPERGGLLDSTTFSLLNYAAGEADAGPDLPREINIDALLVGAGAIGNGVLFLLAHLPVVGSLQVVDNQEYGEENLGTCLLIGPGDVGLGKAAFAEKLLLPKLRVRGYRESVEDTGKRISAGDPMPEVAIGCLDNIPARHALQGLWANLTIDGAIGDFAAQVNRHPWGEQVACLRCLFPLPTGESAEIVASRATGLATNRTQEAGSEITEADVLAAPKERQAWLRERIGRKVCAVVEEAMAQRISTDHLREGFEPSVPFVASMSASLIVAEWLKHILRIHSTLAPRFQMDLFRGPAAGLEFPQDRRADCICVTRRKNIELLREHRQRT